MKRLSVVGMTLGLAFVVMSAAFGQAPDKPYDGHPIKLVVGADIAGSFGMRARLVARHLGRYLPGHPEIVPQSSTGASGVGAASYVFSAPKDGLTIGLFNSAMPLYQAMGQPGIPDNNQLSWIGSLGRVVSVVIVWHGIGVNSIEEAKNREIIMGATGVRGTTAQYPALLNNLFGMKFKIIGGYSTNTNIYAALERGEVEGVGGAYWSSYQAIKPNWIRDRMIVPLLQMNTKKDPSLPDVPLVTELAKTDEQRDLLSFILANTAYEYPFAAPPQIPASRLETLRRAFDQTMKDPAFLAEAKHQLIEVEPLTGEELQAIVARILGAPPSVVAKAQEAMTRGLPK